MANRISIVVPNYNGSKTIGMCLDSLLSSRHDNVEVVVVDDCSDDNSVEMIKQYSCRLVQLETHAGASKARNIGAQNSTGDVLFFTDADCVVTNDALSAARRTFSETGSGVVIGGTYTRLPYDSGFFSTFQSVFINYSETKKSERPDYIPSHAMVIAAETFRSTGGFPEDFLPILEDVEFSHRLRRAGYTLVMNPEIQVQHIFNHSFRKSMLNAVKKSKYWTLYSIMNKDLFADSGTASSELKVNGFSCLVNASLVLTSLLSGTVVFLTPVPVIFVFNIFVNRRLINAFYETKGFLFAVRATLYYTLLYPFAVLAGSPAGTLRYLRRCGNHRKLA